MRAMTIKLAPVSVDPSQPGLKPLLARRRSRRAPYTDTPLNLEDVTHLLWAAQGITSAQGQRTAPSAGALYPLEVYLIAGHVLGLDQGIYHYVPAEHALTKKRAGDVRAKISAAALGQESARDAPAVIAITAVVSRTQTKYRERAERYVDLEAGHAAQNVFLLAVERGLGAVVFGAFNDDDLAEALQLRAGERPIYLMPIGHPA